jgi:hypothetical protein
MEEVIACYCNGHAEQTTSAHCLFTELCDVLYVRVNEPMSYIDSTVKMLVADRTVLTPPPVVVVVVVAAAAAGL